MESATSRAHREAALRVAKTILLVEDDLEVREITRAILREFGYVVLTAESECQALWLWERHHLEIELLVADMMIPNCATGLDLAKKLRAQKPKLKVLITSGFGREIGDDDPAFLKKTPFLQKPYTAQILLDSVSRCLEEMNPPHSTRGCPPASGVANSAS